MHINYLGLDAGLLSY